MPIDAHPMYVLKSLSNKSWSVYSIIAVEDISTHDSLNISMFLDLSSSIGLSPP